MTYSVHTDFHCPAPYCVPPVWQLKHPTLISQTLSDSVLCGWSCVAQLVLHRNDLAKVRRSIQWDYTHTRKMQSLHRKALWMKVPSELHIYYRSPESTVQTPKEKSASAETRETREEIRLNKAVFDMD